MSTRKKLSIKVIINLIAIQFHNNIIYQHTICLGFEESAGRFKCEEGCCGKNKCYEQTKYI